MADVAGVEKLFPQVPVQVLGVDLEDGLTCIQVGFYRIRTKWGHPRGGGTPPQSRQHSLQGAQQ